MSKKANDKQYNNRETKLDKEIMDEGKPESSGTSQPHQARKVPLGPNTNR